MKSSNQRPEHNAQNETCETGKGDFLSFHGKSGYILQM